MFRVSRSLRWFSQRSFGVCVLLALGRLLQVPAYAQAKEEGAEHLVWADEFNQMSPDPDPKRWTYETGGGGWGNGELETYCSPQTTDSPCEPVKQSNAYVGEDGYLHILAHRNSAGQWTSARLVTHGLASFQYGRVEARIRLPRSEGVWPAFWMLGDDVGQHPWPACGELDIMENVGKEPSVVHGSVHGPGFAGAVLTQSFALPGKQSFAADFHVFGMIWAPDRVQFYVDDPTRPYVTYTPSQMPKGSVWPFNNGRYFLLLNLAMGGNWPGPPNAYTANPSEMLVDYVRVYQRSTAP